MLSFLTAENKLSICAWLYPESKAAEIAGYLVVDNPEGLLPVSTYDNDYKPKCTVSVLSGIDSIDAFAAAKNQVHKECDSLTIYKENELNWYAATIGHEGMCLVQDDNQLASLVKAGFNASIKAPHWW